MAKAFLKDVVVISVGKQAEGIAEILDSKKHVNEFVIAKKLDITINQARNILYKLSDFGLVSSIRKKDKKKGWYTYFWKIESLKSLEFLRGTLTSRIEQLNNQMKSRMAKTFYVCKRCNVEFTEENALSCDFTCNECGELFVLSDNEKILREFRRNLDKLKRELEVIDAEIKKEREKINLQKAKEIEKEAKIKKKEKTEKLAAKNLLKVKKKPKEIPAKKSVQKKKEQKKSDKILKKIPAKKSTKIKRR